MHEVNKYLIDSYINSWDVYHLRPLCSVVYFFARQTPFVQSYVYFAQSPSSSLFRTVQVDTATV